MTNTTPATRSASAKALVAASEIPAAKRGRPVGSGHVWPALVDQVSEADPGTLFTYPDPVNPGTAQYLRNRYSLNITTRALPGSSGKLVTMYIETPKPVKRQRRQSKPTVPTAEA